MYDTNIKSRLGTSKVKLNRNQNGLIGRIGKKNLQSRLGTNAVMKNTGKPIKIKKMNLKTQVQNISGTDIRNKIIAKKRQNITDARDRLAEIAKSEDARVKLNKIKTNQPSHMQNSSVQVIPKSIKKTVNNVVRKYVGAVNTVQNKQNGALNVLKTGLDGKTSMKAGALIRTVSGNSRPYPASSRPLLKKINSNRLASAAVLNSNRYHHLRNNPSVVTIKNENAARRLQHNRLSNHQIRVNQALPDYGQQFQIQAPQPIQTAPMYGNYEGPVWVQQPMQIQDEIRPTQLRITTANNYMDYYPAPTQRYEEHLASSYRPIAARPMAPKRSLLYDTYEEYTPVPKKQELSSEIISRLDRPQRANGNGFKIVVTNLHHVVTLEDVEELFGNIGPIKSARIVRDGVAEIIFLHEDDAYRSVQVYHNRQLDGLPMNVAVVARKLDTASRHLGMSRKEASPPNAYRPIPSFRASPPRRAQPSFLPSAGNRATTKSVLRAAGGGTSIHDSSQQYNKRVHQLDVAPDISTIHQALFSGKGNTPLSNQQFYVKLPKPALRGMK